VAVLETTIDCASIIFPITPPELFAAAIKIGLRPTCDAVIFCRLPNKTFDEVSDPVNATPNQPSIVPKNGYNHPVLANANLPLVKGLAWMEDVHYNGCKFGSPECNHTFVWDNFGFDGPRPYRDRSFDYPDAGVMHGTRMALGYEIDAGATRLFNIAGVGWDQTPTGGLVMFNFSNGNGVASPPQVRINGGAWHTMTWQWQQPTPTNWCGWCPVAVPVTLSEVRLGTNAVEVKAGDDMVISNLNLVMIAAAP